MKVDLKAGARVVEMEILSVTESVALKVSSRVVWMGTSMVASMAVR